MSDMPTPCDCDCHTNLYAACSVLGGCGSKHRQPTPQIRIPARLLTTLTAVRSEPELATQHEPAAEPELKPARDDSPPPGTCRNWTNCKAFDPTTQQAWPTTNPLCDTCLDAADPVIRGLVYDYLDLAQLHEASLSQAINEHTSGGSDGESPMLLAGHVEALQAEMVHVATTWECEVRAHTRLSDPPNHVRPGAALQRAISILTPRLRMLSLLAPTTVYPTGCEDEPQDVAGWEAIQHLAHLHQRARSTLGRTRRSFWIPGECWPVGDGGCDARPTPGVDGPLYRSEPRDEGDPLQVCCSRCGAYRPYEDYELYADGGSLIWPTSWMLRDAA